MRLDFEVTEILLGEDEDSEDCKDTEDSEGECEDSEGACEDTEVREAPGGHNTGTGSVSVTEAEIRRTRVKLTTCK